MLYSCTLKSFTTSHAPPSLKYRHNLDQRLTGTKRTLSNIIPPTITTPYKFSLKRPHSLRKKYDNLLNRGSSRDLDIIAIHLDRSYRFKESIRNRSTLILMSRKDPDIRLMGNNTVLDALKFFCGFKL